VWSIWILIGRGLHSVVGLTVEQPLFQLTTSTSQRPNWYVQNNGLAVECVDAIGVLHIS
jgi:hypothetical protein